jgi:hypothetical protein
MASKLTNRNKKPTGKAASNKRYKTEKEINAAAAGAALRPDPLKKKRRLPPSFDEKPGWHQLTGDDLVRRATVPAWRHPDPARARAHPLARHLLVFPRRYQLLL